MSNQSNLSKKEPTNSSVWPWQSVLSQLPSSPGVYWFRGADNQVLYVGKAKNLKHRVSSYARISSAQPKTYQLVSTAQSLKFETVDTEVEALILEASLIQTYQPHFNILLKDDKTPLYVVITTDEFPRVLTARKKQLLTSLTTIPKQNVFGPFQSSLDARRVIKLSRRIFKFRNASPVNRKLHKPCFYTHINLCAGACMGAVTAQEYKQTITNLKKFLRGQKRALLKDLRQQMNHFSAAQAYEMAALVRDQLQSLERLYQSQAPVLADEYLPVLEADVYTERLTKLRSVLHNTGFISGTYPLDRIEAYDISNTSGTLVTASMVVFEQGKPAVGEYRMFKIRLVTGPNDFAMLTEAVARRLNHPEWTYPNLIVVDGGKGQLRAVLKVTAGKIPTVSIAKRPDRLLIPRRVHGKLEYREIKLTDGHPVSSLIQGLRDESHRFAKNYHIKLRNKHMVEV